MSKQIQLLRARRFLPLLLTQTTGAFNDNLFKSAFIMLITYGAAAGPDPGGVAAIAGGALIAPFFLFSATAGELADRFERSRLLQILKAAELVAVFGAAAALLTGDLALSLVLLFVLGTQAAFSSPVKIRAAAAAPCDRRAGRRQRLDGGRHLSLDSRRHDRRRGRGRNRLGTSRLLHPAARLRGFRLCREPAGAD